MDDITYEIDSDIDSDGNSCVKIKSEIIMPANEFYKDSKYNLMDILISSDMIISVHSDYIKIVKDRYGTQRKLDNIDEIINLFTNIISYKLSTKVEIFDDGIKTQLKNSILKVLKNNKLLKE